MRRDCSLAKLAEATFLLAVTVMFTALVFNSKHLTLDTEKQQEISSGSLSFARDEMIQDETPCEKLPCIRPYKQGLDIIYQPLINCAKPPFLANYTNPCWNSTGKVTCAARVMMLGFPRCGSSDMNQWFNQHSHVILSSSDYFYYGGLYPGCPNTWLQQNPKGSKFLADKSKMGYGSCTGCTIISRTLNSTSTYILRQSAIQYLQYTMTKQSRYVISMRNPSERIISNYFHTYNLKKPSNMYIGFNMKHIGHSFFHMITLDAVDSITDCLQRHGTTVCILQPDLFKLRKQDLFFSHMLTIGCYSTHLKELFKFIPKEAVYFSKLEEYSKDEAGAMEKIYRYLGLPVTGIDTGVKSNFTATIHKKGLDNKPVLPETRTLLKKFYEPFNVELAALLGDDKWLWT